MACSVTTLLYFLLYEKFSELDNLKRDARSNNMNIKKFTKSKSQRKSEDMNQRRTGDIKK
jgi:hypothetical protein